MESEACDRVTRRGGTASRRRSIGSLLAAAAVGVAALGPSTQPAAAITRKQYACKVKGARVLGQGEGICLMSPAANASQAKRDECVSDAAHCGDLATACKADAASACQSGFFTKWAS
jgi:hypothetical protein